MLVDQKNRIQVDRSNPCRSRPNRLPDSQSVSSISRQQQVAEPREHAPLRATWHYAADITSCPEHLAWEHCNDRSHLATSQREPHTQANIGDVDPTASRTRILHRMGIIKKSPLVH